MPMMTLHRDYVLPTLKGHSIGFKKDVPTYVPASVYPEALAIGAIPAEGDALDLIAPPPVSNAPSDTTERSLQILTAIEKIVTINERKDFTAAGVPTVKAVEREVKFDVDAREVAAVWQDFHNKQAS